MDESQDLFGQVALRRGFITADQLREARLCQRQSPEGTPRLIGLILLDAGTLSTSQLIEVLREVRLLTTAQWMRRRERLARVRGKVG
jgi:hypothetical protein